MKLLTILFFLTTIAVSGRTLYVTRVVDGDTFKDSTGMSYRMVGINAPERHDKGGFEATQFLDSLINHKYVQIVIDSKYDTIDFYKRKLCYVFLNGTDIDKLMVQTGHAIAFTKYPFGKMQEYVNAEKEFTKGNSSLLSPNSTSNPNDNTFSNNKDIKKYTLLTLVIILMIIGLFYFYKK